MAQDQLWKPQPTRRSGGRAFAYRGSHLPHAEPQFTRLSRSRHPLTPKSAISPFAADNSPDYLNYYQTVQLLERDCSDGEEIECNDRLAMISKKCEPTLARISAVKDAP